MCNPVTYNGLFFKLKLIKDDCNRVLITSKGHVTMAPIVPPILVRNKKRNAIKNEDKERTLASKRKENGH